LLPFFQECEALGACVFVHPWYMDSPAQQKYWTPWLVGMPAETALAACSLIFGGVLEKCPLLRVGLAHGGGSFPFCLGRIQHGFEVRPDLCAVDNPHPPTQYVQRFYVDSLVHAPKALEYLVDMFTPQRVMLGTDYPFPLGELLAGDLIEQCACCSDEDKQQMLAGTAAEFLGRKDLL
jgi:aminocarboxymuconate-semialdehyde decarboxylase